jgi:lipoyl-dependent peroxiredoxin
MPAYTIKPLVTAIAIGTGGRNGHTETTDHSVSVNLSVRKEMGGPGLPDTTTPEHLFAAGYAACFGGAIEFVARQHKKDVKGTVRMPHIRRAARRRRLRHLRQDAGQGSNAAET